MASTLSSFRSRHTADRTFDKPRLKDIQVVGNARVQVTDGAALVFEGTLPPGGTYEVPAHARAPRLRAGNAGAVYVRVGDDLYGPLGRPRRVVRNLSLLPDDIEDRVQRADPAALPRG